jgi:hypothetical protein
MKAVVFHGIGDISLDKRVNQTGKINSRRSARTRNLQPQRVEVHDRMHGLERALLPLLEPRFDGIRSRNIAAGAEQSVRWSNPPCRSTSRSPPRN